MLKSDFSNFIFYIDQHLSYRFISEIGNMLSLNKSENEKEKNSLFGLSCYFLTALL